MEIVVEENNAYLTVFPGMRTQVNERSTVGLVREPLILEQEGLATCLIL
jgi:hypothetical protein